MNEKSTNNNNDTPVSAQQTHTNDGPDIPAPGYPELIMMKIGVVKHPYLYALLYVPFSNYTTWFRLLIPHFAGTGLLFLHLSLYEYVCRRYCDMDTDRCRSRRKDIIFWISGFFMVLGIRGKYREALTRKAVAAWEKGREERIKQVEEASTPAN